jgi:predicted dehydrogenase
VVPPVGANAMGLVSALGLESGKKVRYGIVALGDIAQESLMPGVAHTGNSVVTALVTGDPAKAAEVGRRYDVPPDAVYNYEQFPALLSSGKVDAIYLATPNWRHADFAALRAGVHVLLEKPMEVSVAKCQQILDAQQAAPAGTKLMLAYRLHFEPATLAVVDLIRSGKLGTIRSFSSTFAQNVNPDNHRAQHGVAAGPLLDMGPYPLNAVRNLFEAEPTEAFAYSVRHADSRLGDLDDTVAVTLRFPGDRLAQFTVSYVGNTIDTYTVLGSAGSVEVEPAFMFGKPLAYKLKVGTKESTESFKNTDHFGGELRYFSDCILNGRDPEPDGTEGLLDVRVLEAIVESTQTGRPVALPPVQRPRRIDLGQVQKLRAVSPPEPVNAKQPSK